MILFIELNTQSAKTVFQNRAKKINYQRLQNLCLIGEYQRRIPVSLTRMIENAYDWEHLPFVHSSSFKSIDLFDEGAWGWQAKAILPDSSSQYLELLVDRDNNYWVTTVLSGDARGFEIHTQAIARQDREIDVLVKFYLPEAFSKVLMLLRTSQRLLPLSLYRRIASKIGIHRVAKNESPKTSILKTLQRQYSVLYDEDETLMSSRQAAIDHRKESKLNGTPESLILGTPEQVTQQLPKVVQFGKQRFVINRWRGEWRVYAAECPHLLGPLESAQIDQNGQITCPWHGYKFDISNGRGCTNNELSLATPPVLTLVDGYLTLSSN